MLYRGFKEEDVAYFKLLSRHLLEGLRRIERKPDSLTAICEPII
jgi:hypothetical protein